MLVWVVILVIVVLPRWSPPQQHSVATAVTQLTAFDRSSVVQQSRSARVQAAQMAQVQSWSQELMQGVADYEAKQKAAAAAQAQAAAISARSNHPAPPPDIAQDIINASTPLASGAVQWPMNVAWGESRYHPTSVNSSRGASGLFQFLPSPWAFPPYASHPP